MLAFDDDLFFLQDIDNGKTIKYIEKKMEKEKDETPHKGQTSMHADI